jgi:hypothetical protein
MQVHLILEFGKIISGLFSLFLCAFLEGFKFVIRNEEDH